MPSTEELFDLSDEYESMLRRGISLSGEDQRFFLEGRVADLRGRLPEGFAPRRILDFGCGIGHTTEHLAQVFPTAEVLGVDTAQNAVEAARSRYGNDRIRFGLLDAMEREGSFDLCYVNGVFHHIAPLERAGVVARIHATLRPGGLFALFENNPWNPGTRLVMRRIPFDRNAITLSPRETRRLLSEAGFALRIPTRSLFYFPRPLRFLRFAEPRLAALPLGAQYYTLAERQG